MTISMLTALILGGLFLLRFLTLGVSLTVLGRRVPVLPALVIALVTLTMDGLLWVIDVTLAMNSLSLVGVSLGVRAVTIGVLLQLSYQRGLGVALVQVVLEMLVGIGLSLMIIPLVGWLG
jgi:hypothetical protein